MYDKQVGLFGIVIKIGPNLIANCRFKKNCDANRSSNCKIAIFLGIRVEYWYRKRLLISACFFDAYTQYTSEVHS